MAVKVTDIKIYDQFTGTGGGGVRYLNGNVMDEMTAVISFYSYLAALSKNLTFAAAGDTITNADDTDTDSFVTLGFRVGMTITVENSVSNNSSFTIIDVQDRVITVAEALVDETAAAADIYDDTPITALNFYYNLLENSQAANYQSLIDKSAVQRYTASGLDASVTTPVNMQVSSYSRAWVPNAITNEATGETNQVFVKGVSIANHKQSFTIEHKFRVAPFWLADQLANFENGVPPEYLAEGKALRYLCKIDAKFDAIDPNIPHTGGDEATKGISSWLNANNIRTKSEYYVDSISYTDNATAAELDKLDYDKIIDCVVVIKSRSGQFVNAATKILLDFMQVSKAEQDYQDPDKTLLQNFLNDRALITLGSTANGVYYGTDYQILYNIQPVIVDANTVRITFQFLPSDYAKALVLAREEQNRNYAIMVTTQDEDITDTLQSDRVTLLADFQNADYDLDDATLVELADGFRNYRYPNIDVSPKDDVAAYEGDPIYTEVPFRVKSEILNGITPTIQRVGVQIVARLEGQEDYVIQEQIFNVGQAVKNCGTQQVDLSADQGFTGLPDEYTFARLRNDSRWDDTNYSGFLIRYPFAIGYEFWRPLTPLVEQINHPIFNDIANPTQAWKSLAVQACPAGTPSGSGSSGAGALTYTLAVKFIADVEGYDGHVTQFSSYADLSVKEFGAAADSGPVMTPDMSYFDEDGNETDAVQKLGRTRIKATFTGNWQQDDCAWGNDIIVGIGFPPPYIMPPGSSQLYGSAIVEIGKRYKLTYTFTAENLDVIGINADFIHPFPTNTAAGTYEYEFVADETGEFELKFYNTGADVLTLTNATIQECTPQESSPVAAYLFADIYELGSRVKRLLASSEYDAEVGSPFSAADADPDADQSWQSRNLTINLFADKITFECWFDDRRVLWSNITEAVIFQARLDFVQNCYILAENGEYLLSEDGQRIKTETC